VSEWQANKDSSRSTTLARRCSWGVIVTTGRVDNGQCTQHPDAPEWDFDAEELEWLLQMARGEVERV